MKLDDMSIGDLKSLNQSLTTVEQAAEVLGGLPASADGGVRISIQPGEFVTLTSAFVMPECGERDASGGPALVETMPEVLPASEMVGGSGDLQRHVHAESPPAEPAAIPPETGASPEAIPRAEAPVGEVASAAAPTGAPSGMGNFASPAWTDDEEAHLVVLVACRIVEGDTRRVAVEKAAALVGRTASACDNRLNTKLKDRLKRAIIHQQDEKAKRGAGVAKVVASVPVKSAPVAPAKAAAPAPATSAPADIPPLTMMQRTILEAIGKLSGRKGFDAELDLEIVEGFARGSKTAALALDLDIDAAMLVGRYKDLTACIRDDRGNMSIDGQADLMRVLRHLVREARGVAA